MDHRFTNFSGITTGGLASSSILDNSPKYYIGTISYYLHPVLTNLSSSKFIKCYHAQTDGWNSTTFHSKCNGKGPTISVIQFGNYTFRGYTNASWQVMHFQLVISCRGGGQVNNILYLARKYALIVVRRHYLFQDAHSFPRAKLEENFERRKDICAYFCAKWTPLCLLSFNYFVKRVEKTLRTAYCLLRGMVSGTTS